MSKSEMEALLHEPDHDQRTRATGRRARNVAEHLDTVTQIAVAAQEALRVTVVGLDYRQYHRFKSLTPRVGRYAGGRVRYFTHPGYAPNDDEFDYCRQFVITVALHLAQLEAHTIPPSWMSRP